MISITMWRFYLLLDYTLALAFAFWFVPLLLLIFWLWVLWGKKSHHKSPWYGAVKLWLPRAVGAIVLSNLVYIALSIAFLPPNNSSFATPRNQELLKSGEYAQCAWLGLVPRSWVCEDRWQGNDRHLLAYNPNRPSQFVELSIDPPLLYRPCLPLVVTDLPLEPRHSAGFSSVPHVCLGMGITYRATYVQEGTFVLVGNGISRQLFSDILSNVSNQHQNHFFTTHPSFSLQPTHLSKAEQKATPMFTFRLSNTKLCAVNDKGEHVLKEQILVRIGDPNANPASVSIANADQCELSVTVPSDQLPIGTHTVYTTINGLTRILKTPVEMSE